MTTVKVKVGGPKKTARRLFSDHKAALFERSENHKVCEHKYEYHRNHSICVSRFSSSHGVKLEETDSDTRAQVHIAEIRRDSFYDMSKSYHVILCHIMLKPGPKLLPKTRHSA